ncbi:MAG: type III-B CRISPR module RAMP protein Cmr4 [Methanothrix sp.]|uniref:type III-B CRISPR module RAMP protein Cmr4 n=1 Tax=Methanothrix sp. TaxID=90426 RepID=UPI0032AEA1CA|nr:type III-B CRISPR module RAMP protein Cmr4 [Methanothrix sp.]
MKGMMLGMLAETNIHSGAGRSEGFVDLPVAREAVTGYPVIAGSSLKGALRDTARESGLDESICKSIFGTEDRAGDILVSDARLLLLPVRSLTGPYKWITCPHILERLSRDLKLCGLSDGFEVVSVKKGEAIWSGDHLFLEEREFRRVDGMDEKLKPVRAALEKMILHQKTASRLDKQLVIISDDDFQWFASYGLPVAARNRLDENKKSKNLWYEESLAPDTLMYAMVFERRDGALERLKSMFQDNPYLQLGGNETVGMGWFAVKILEKGEGR